MNIDGFIGRLDAELLKIKRYPRFIADFIAQREMGEVLISLVRDQMLRGRDGDGNVLTPGYLQDPYFRTPDEASWYYHKKNEMQHWHDSLIENDVEWPEKSDNTPNLIWNGAFQFAMFIMYNPEKFKIGSRYDDSKDIEDKYNNNLFKLAPLSASYFWAYYLYEASLRYFERI